MNHDPLFGAIISMGALKSRTRERVCNDDVCVITRGLSAGKAVIVGDLHGGSNIASFPRTHGLWNMSLPGLTPHVCGIKAQLVLQAASKRRASVHARASEKDLRVADLDGTASASTHQDSAQGIRPGLAG